MMLKPAFTLGTASIVSPLCLRSLMTNLLLTKKVQVKLKSDKQSPPVRLVRCRLLTTKHQTKLYNAMITLAQFPH